MHGGKRTGAGRKRIRIDLEEAEKLYTMQCTDEEVAAWFDVRVRTIERRRHRDPAFRAAVERGQAKGRISLRRALFSQANKGSAAASIFLAKNLLGYRDVQRSEIGPEGSGSAQKGNDHPIRVIVRSVLDPKPKD